MADFFTVHFRTVTPFLLAWPHRNGCAECANASEARLIRTDAKYVPPSESNASQTSASVVEHYRRAFRQQPVDFAPIVDADEPREVP